MHVLQTDAESLVDEAERIISIPCGPRPPNSRPIIVPSTSAKGKRALAAARKSSHGKSAHSWKPGVDERTLARLANSRHARTHAQKLPMARCSGQVSAHSLLSPCCVLSRCFAMS
jgi:hypothetical protein